MFYHIAAFTSNYMKKSTHYAYDENLVQEKLNKRKATDNTSRTVLNICKV